MLFLTRRFTAKQKLSIVAVLVLFLVAGIQTAGAQSGENGIEGLPALADVLPSLSESDERLLVDDGQFLRFHSDGMSPGLLPETELTAAVARELIAGDLNIGIEGLFFTASEELPSSYSTMARDERTLELYNILRSVSTLIGLEYFSASRGEMRLLFEESWAVADPGEPRDPLPDPLVQTIPADDSIFIHQKDKTFANNQSEMRFLSASDAFSAVIVNISPMRYKGLIRVVDPGKMQTHLIVVPVREGLLIYGTMSARTRDVRSFVDRAEASFTNRVIALTGWYRSRLEEEFRG